MYSLKGLTDGMAYGILDYVRPSYFGVYRFYDIRKCQNTNMEFTKGLNHVKSMENIIIVKFYHLFKFFILLIVILSGCQFQFKKNIQNSKTHLKVLFFLA